MTGFFLFMICFFFVSLVVTAKQHRKHVAMTDRKQCRHCGASYGAEARFCGRCGKAF